MDAKAWAKDALTGYVAVSFTPYRADGGIDHDAVAADVEYTLSLPHIGGLYVGSIYQEFWLLSVRERMALAQTVIGAAAGRVPVIVAASHTVAEEAIALARHAADAGADLVMLWPPYFGPRDHEGILAFYHQVMAGADIGFAFSERRPRRGPKPPDGRWRSSIGSARPTWIRVLKEASLWRTCSSRHDREHRRPRAGEQPAGGVLACCRSRRPTWRRNS